MSHFVSYYSLFILKFILSDTSIATTEFFHFHLHGISFYIPLLSVCVSFDIK